MAKTMLGGGGPMIRFGTLTWEPRRGGSAMRRGPLPELGVQLRSLRCPAALYADGSEEPIGGARERLPGDGCDDKRIKWFWWYDATAFE